MNPADMCFEDKCEKESVFSCKKCDGSFCEEHFELNHPKGVCIHE